jgi:hypothetical protein
MKSAGVEGYAGGRRSVLRKMDDDDRAAVRGKAKAVKRRQEANRSRWGWWIFRLEKVVRGGFDRRSR